MVHPGARSRGAGARHQPIFQCPVLPFNQPIALGMIGRRHALVDAQEGAKLGPQARGELAAPVRDNGRGDAVPGDPVTEEGEGAVLSGDGGQWDRLQPSGETVNDGEEIGISLGRGKGPDEVQVQGGEPVVRHVQRGQRNLGVADNLRALARDA